MISPHLGTRKTKVSVFLSVLVLMSAKFASAHYAQCVVQPGSDGYKHMYTTCSGDSIAQDPCSQARTPDYGSCVTSLGAGYCAGCSYVTSSSVPQYTQSGTCDPNTGACLYSGGWTYNGPTTQTICQNVNECP